MISIQISNFNYFGDNYRFTDYYFIDRINGEIIFTKTESRIK